MESQIIFLDCPAQLDETGNPSCGLPALVQYRYRMRSTDGPLECAKIRCPRGHWFSGPLGSLTINPCLTGEARAGYVRRPPAAR